MTRILFLEVTKEQLHHCTKVHCTSICMLMVFVSMLVNPSLLNKCERVGYLENLNIWSHIYKHYIIIYTENYKLCRDRYVKGPASFICMLFFSAFLLLYFTFPLLWLSQYVAEDWFSDFLLCISWFANSCLVKSVMEDVYIFLLSLLQELMRVTGWSWSITPSSFLSTTKPHVSSKQKIRDCQVR